MKKYVIDELRKNKGVSQQALADFVGVSRTTVTRWENSTVENKDEFDISDKNIKKIAEYFDCDVEDIYNKDQSDWISVAASDGEKARQKIGEDNSAIKTFKTKVLGELKNNSKDRVSELLLELMVDYDLSFDFYIMFLDEKDESRYKNLCYAFLSKL